MRASLFGHLALLMVTGLFCVLTAAGGAPAAATAPDSGLTDQKICQFRHTDILVNSLLRPAKREVSEEELAWMQEQIKRKQRGEPCVLPDGYAAQFREAMAHNAAFEAGIRTGLSPQTTGDRLLCAAAWNRWNYAVQSAASVSFVSALRRDLSADNASKREAFWRAQAGDVARLADERAAAEEAADDLYAAYAHGEDRGLETLMERLAICK